MITRMRNVHTIYSIFIFLACAHTVSFASSLLSPTKFPKTFSDVDFVSKVKLKTEDYDRYATLSPYEHFILEKADENIERQILQDLADEEQNEQDQNEQQPSTDTPTTDSTPGQTTPIQPTSPAQPSQPPAQDNNTTVISGGYCEVRQPGIPANQKIPFGSPVLHDHFIYCSPYANLNRGSGSRPHTGYDIGCTEESFDEPIFTRAVGIVKLFKPNQTDK